MFLVAVGEAVHDRNTADANVIDKLQYLSEPEMSALIMAIHKVSQRSLVLVLVGEAGKSPSYAERLFT